MALKCLLLFLVLAIGAGMVLTGEAQEKPMTWRGWDSYQVILWSTGGVPENASLWFERLREAGITAQELDRGGTHQVFLDHHFDFYVENLYRIAFLHQARATYEADFKGYTATRGKRYLVRKPCLHDPDYLPQAREILQRYVRQHQEGKPLLYDIGDEMSIGSFASPMDYCFSEHTLRAFRKWLQEQYGSLEALNREWETHFSSWDAVEPMTTYEIKERERQGSENYSPWADHRTFMEITFAETLRKFREFIREVDPAVPVGAEGLQMPSAWGGYDLWRLSQVFDWIEPYDIGNSREIFRSFMPEGLILSTLFEMDGKSAGRRLWRLLLTGDRGTIIWDDENSRCVDKTKDDMPLTPRGKELAPVFQELRRMAPMIFKLKPLDDCIAIHYSQASIHAHWMFDSRPDKDSWPRRFSSYEAVHSRMARVRDSFVRVIEDLGLQYHFVSYEQIERGDLLKEGHKVLLLPQSVAMSKKECEQIEAFVRAGGTVIADNMAATMDEHCKRLPKGQLDELFGIARQGSEAGGQGPAKGLKWKGKTLDLEVAESVGLTTGKAQDDGNGVPCIVVNRVGKGQAIYLNFLMLSYGKLRLTPPKEQPVREVFGALLKQAGIAPPVKVLYADTPAYVPGVRIWRYRGAGADYVAIMRNPEFRASELGEIGYGNNTAFEKIERVQVIFPKKKHIQDVREGKSLGTTDRVTVVLDPWSPKILELR